MAKVTVISNWRVEIEPCFYVYSKQTDKEKRRMCEELVKDAKRHLDIDSATVKYDSTEECEFCGYKWESAVDDDGKPACCDKAVDEWQEKHPDSQQFGAGA